MKRIKKVLVLGLLIMISLIGLIGCNSIENKFSLEDLKNEMKAKGHEVRFEEESTDNLLGPICNSITLDDYIIVNGKHYILYNTVLYIYSYENNEEMEKASSIINADASVITKGEIPMEINWHNTPHFYKKGTIIVRYEGNDEKIINDLKEIMGEQFAGK